MTTRRKEAAEALLDAIGSLGPPFVAAMPPDPATGVDLTLSGADGRSVGVQVKRLSTLTPSAVTRAYSDWHASAEPDELLVLVADRVPRSAQEILRELRVGWLDLRGHLRMVGPGLFIDTDVHVARPRQQRVDAFSGSVGLEVSCWLLMHPTEEHGVRDIARALNRSPSAVSDVLKSLREQRLVKVGNRPLIPDLFWETAHAWQSPSIALAGLPRPDQGAMNDLLELGFEQIESTRGWALTDTMAAVAYGAPVGVKVDYPPDFYVPSDSVARRAASFFGHATGWETRVMTIRVAPVPAVCNRRVDLSSEHWPVANPLFVALDLTLDPARGREVLETWTPPKPWRRVW